MSLNDSRLARKVVWGSRVGLAVLISSIAFGGCGKAGEGRGPAVLVLDTLQAASGAEPDKFSNFLESDVVTNIRVGTVFVPSIFEDLGRASAHIAMKDVAAPTTSTNAIMVTRYRVVYLRSDGRNTPGVDVPYPFDGAVSQTITEDVSAFTFILVRGSAKLEAPLRSLAGLGGSHFISTIAQVTFYGTDGAGNTVSITGQMTINFADWGDPAS